MILLALCAVPGILQALDQGFYIGLATRILIFALAASSLNLVLGFGGMVSLGHAAFFGAGAYVAALCQQAGLGEALLVLPLAMVGLLALGVGAISLRTRGVYFIMIALAFAQMVYYLFISARAWGDDDGLPLAGRLRFAGFSLADDAALFCLALGVLGLALFLFGRLAGARFGRTIQAIRENETRMEALGYPVFRYRLACFALGGAVAGLAGALLANLTGLASPALLQWTQSGTLLVMVIIGGVGYLHGGVVGALVLLLLEEVLLGFFEHWHIALGLLLGIVFFAPRGGWRPCSGKPMAEALLEVRGLSRRFAAVDALRDVNFSVDAGEVHALIGPNGAGKTTFIHHVSVALQPDAGSVHFAGRDVTSLTMHQRVAAGMARSYQITNIFRGLSALDNVVLAVQGRPDAGSSFRFWRPVRSERWLFDEPMAGTGPEESARMVELIEHLARHVTIVSALLEIAGLEVAYGQSQVLFGVDLALAEGEAATLLGRNGMGKTTTLRAICGLQPIRGGSIRFAGERIDGWRPDRIGRAGIALVPEGRQCFPNLTVDEYLRAFFANRRAAAGSRVRTVPAPARAQPRQPVVGRRTADAGDWSRAGH